MKIIGIDPGTAIVGFGIIEHNKKSVLIDAGVIATDKNLSDSQRLATIAKDLGELLDLHKPELAVLEKIYFSKNIKTAITVAQARGVIILLLEQHGIPFMECSPQDVKIAVTGYGAAPKKQVQEMVKHLLNLPSIPKPDDAADALAAALSATHKIKTFFRKN